MFNDLIFNSLVALEVVGRKSGRIIPILKAYLHAASGAYPHVHVDKDAPLAEFEKIAADNPVFRATSIQEMLHGI